MMSFASEKNNHFSCCEELNWQQGERECSTIVRARDDGGTDQDGGEEDSRDNQGKNWNELAMTDMG